MESLRNDMKPLGAAGLSTVLIKKKRVLTLPNPDIPQNAVKGELPATLKPHLATLVDGPPGDPAEWAYEFKFDGYRILARIDGEKIQLVARNGDDWSRQVARKGILWVKPQLVAEISFSAWTKGGHIRYPVFHGFKNRQEERQAPV
jgi:ATP-dependent DNA ligase